jgi:hypothetical protein
MAISGQLRATAAFSQGDSRPVPTGYEAGWPPEPVWTLWRREKNLLPQPGIEARFLDRPARSLSTKAKLQTWRQLRIAATEFGRNPPNTS